MRVLSGLIVLTYTYLTLDRPEVTASVLGKARLFTEMQVLNHAVTTATPATTCVELNQCVGFLRPSQLRKLADEVTWSPQYSRNRRNWAFHVLHLLAE